METKLSCFVIIGYGEKISYANGKVRKLDLEETYKLLIKPVFDSLNISCYRAIDKNLTANIDKIMLQEIKSADIALVDISTLNANVLWELGVRHALKPHYTIMICEKAQMSELPFDINHFPVHEYIHSEEGIPFKEVDRFKNHLTKVVKGILEQKPQEVDSPVHVILNDESNLHKTAKEIPFRANEKNANYTFATIMKDVEIAKNNEKYKGALELLNFAKKHALVNMALKDNLSLIISRQALCTYKLKEPNEVEALVNAKNIIAELKPETSNDVEVLGLSGAIEKRLFEITNDDEYLENSLLFYEKGFQIKHDYYNGINLAFILYIKTELLKIQNKEWENTKLKADYITSCVLEISLRLEMLKDFHELHDAIWVLLTIAEAYNYKSVYEKVREYEKKANLLAKKNNDSFAINSYQEQKSKISMLLKRKVI